MADTTLQPGCAPANPDVRLPSRRAVLRGVAVAPLPEVVFKLELSKSREFFDADLNPIIADLRRIGGAA